MTYKPGLAKCLRNQNCAKRAYQIAIDGLQLSILPNLFQIAGLFSRFFPFVFALQIKRGDEQSVITEEGALAIAFLVLFCETVSKYDVNGLSNRALPCSIILVNLNSIAIGQDLT